MTFKKIKSFAIIVTSFIVFVLILLAPKYYFDYRYDNARASSTCYVLIKYYYEDYPEMKMMIYRAIKDRFLSNQECNDLFDYVKARKKQANLYEDDQKLNSILVDIN
jgi:hypothetical protein